MKLIKQSFTLLALLVSFYMSAQVRVDPTPEEKTRAKNLAKKYKNDKDVEVVILKANETFEFKYDRKYKKMIVLQSSKEELMNIKDRAHIAKAVFYDSNSTVTKFKVLSKINRTLHQKVFDEYVKVNDLFYHDQRVKYTGFKFPMQGYKFKFEFEKKITDPKYFTSVYFIKSQPIIKNTIKFVIPKTVDVTLKEMNFTGYDIKKKKYYNPKKKATVYEYTLKNMPANYRENHMQGPSYIYPHILVLTNSYIDKKKVKHTVFAKTDDLYKWYHSLIKKLKEKPADYAAKVKELTKTAKTDEGKIKNIFYWVQDNIRYIAFEDGLAGFKPDESQNVYNKRYGDCKGMANLLTGMLKKAGFDARRTWIGTRRIAYDYSTPSLAVDNHMICTLFLNGKPYYLDATESYVPFGEYAERIQGRQVMIEDGEKYMLKKVPTHDAKHNLKVYTRTMKIEGDNLTGHVKEVYKGQSRTSFLQGYNHIKSNKKKDALKYYLDGGDGNYLLTNIKTSDISNREQDLSIDYDFVLKNAVSSFDDEIYIDIDYDKDFGGLDFEKRKTAYQLYSKTDLESTTNLEIPTSYKISEMPKGLSVSNEDFMINISFKLQGNKLIYHKKMIFPNALIHKKNLQEWQKAYKELDNLYKTQLTLIKK